MLEEEHSSASNTPKVWRTRNIFQLSVHYSVWSARRAKQEGWEKTVRLGGMK